MSIRAVSVLRLISAGFQVVADGINLLALAADRAGGPELCTGCLIVVVALLSSGNQVKALVALLLLRACALATRNIASPSVDEDGSRS